MFYKRHLWLILWLFAIVAPTIIVIKLVDATTNAPVIFFSDILQGPKTGGQNNKGAFVTIYGNFLGATQGTSTMTVGNGLVDNCPVWGSAWLWFQKITCQLGSSVATGNIVVTVGGQSSNTLPFTVNSGTIWFIDHTNGNNSNPGTFASPLKDIYYAKDFKMANGDIAYLRAGLWDAMEPAFPNGAGDGNSVLTMMGYGGVPGAPKMVLGYPGETATIACDRATQICFDVSNHGGACAGWWTFAEVDFGSTWGTDYALAWQDAITSCSANNNDGLRFVGNKIHDTAAVAVVMQGNMNGLQFYGNDDHGYNNICHGAGIGERGYGIYMGGYGTQDHIEIDHNRFYNSNGIARNGRVSIGPPSNTVVTWVSGDTFAPQMANNNCIIVNGSVYTVASVTDATHLVLSSAAPTQSNSVYQSGGFSAKGMQIYGHTPTDQFRHVTVTNNMFLQNCMEGIAIGGSDGGAAPWTEADPVYIYNNLVAGNGSCHVYVAADGSQPIGGFAYSGMQIGDFFGHMTAKIWNNTLYLNAGGTQTGQLAGDMYFIDITTNSYDVSNNTFFAQPVGGTHPYWDFVIQDNGGGAGGATLTGHTNAFFANGNGSSTAPSWLNSDVVSTADPKFITPAIDSTGNFNLQVTSPVKTGGTTLATTPDANGCVRPQDVSFGMGLFEYPLICSVGGGGGGGAAPVYFRGRH